VGYVTGNGNCWPETLVRLAADRARVRICVATHRSTPPEALERLLSDRYRYVARSGLPKVALAMWQLSHGPAQ